MKAGKSQIQVNFEHAIAAAKAQGLVNYEIVREHGAVIIRVKDRGKLAEDVDAEEIMKKASGL